MKITRITLENFRNYGDTTIELEGDRTLVLGENGAGKSTIIDAIAWALTGKCRGVEGGKNARVLVRDGAGAARVEVQIDGWAKPVVRTVTAAGVAGGQALRDAVLERLGTTEAAVRAVLYGGGFFELGHAEAKALLLGVLDVKVLPEQVPELNVTEPLTLEDLDAAYSQAFNERAEAKRALTQVVVPEPPKVASLELGKVSDLDACRAAHQASKAAADKATKALTQRQSKIEAAKRTIARAEAAIGAGGERVEITARTHRELLAEERGKLEAASQLVIDAEAGPTLNELARQRAGLDAVIGKIEGHKPAGGCVLDATIPCLTKAASFTGKLKELRAALGAVDKAEANARAAMQAEADAKATRRALENQIRYHETQIATAEATIAAAAKGGEELAAARQELEELERGLADAQVEAEKHRNDTERAQRALEAAVAYEASTKGRDAAIETQRRLTANVDRLEAIVARLGPKGLRTEILEASIGDFQQAINEGLARFGFAMRIQADPWQVYVGAAGDGGTVHLATLKPFALYSAGEKVAIATAFQVALAMQTGLEFLAIDAAETVVGDNRRRLTDMIMLAPVGQIVVAMARADEEGAPELPGLQVIRLSAGALAAAD